MNPFYEFGFLCFYLIIFLHAFPHIMQRDVGLDPRRKTSGTFSVTRTGSTRRGRGQIGQPMQGFGRQQEEISV